MNPGSRCTLNVGMCDLAGSPSWKPMNASPARRERVSWSCLKTSARPGGPPLTFASIALKRSSVGLRLISAPGSRPHSHR